MEFEQVHGFGSDLLAICCCVGREARWERERGGGGELYTRWKHTSGVMGTVIVPDIFNIRIDEFSNRRCIS